MTIRDVALAARRAGFKADQLVTEIAISGAETGGLFDAESTNDTRRFTELVGVKGSGPWHWRDPLTDERLPDYVDPEYSVGSLNINLLVHDQVPESQARDYQGAADYAYVISTGGTNFGPWSTFTGGAYNAYMPAAREAVEAIEAQEAAEAAQNEADARSAAEAAQAASTAAVPQETPPVVVGAAAPLTVQDFNTIYVSLVNEIPAEGLPFTASLHDGMEMGGSLEVWRLEIRGRNRQDS